MLPTAAEQGRLCYLPGTRPAGKGLWWVSSQQKAAAAPQKKLVPYTQDMMCEL